MYQPGNTAIVEFTISNSAGAAANADSLPTGILARNGLDTATAVTITNVDTGRYRASVPLDPTYVAGDSISISIAATVGGVVAKDIVLNDSLYPGASGIVSALLATAIPNTNASGTVADALNAARAQGFGRWQLTGTTLNIYGADGVTIVRSFTLDSASAPTTRV